MSHLIAEQLNLSGFRPLPVPRGTKAPRLSGWTDYAYDPTDFTTEDNVGVLLGDVVAVDVDVYNPIAANAVKALAENLLGAAPVRVGQAPKCALFYRVARPLTKMKTSEVMLADSQAEKRSAVEVLGQGQQCIISGQHPSGAEYRFIAESLWETPKEALPEVTQEALEWFLQKAAEVLSRYLAEGERPAVYVPFWELPQRLERGDHEGMSYEELKHTLRFAEKVYDLNTREDWFELGCIISYETEGSDEGLDLWDSIVQDYDGYAGYADSQKQWDSFGRNRPVRPLTIGSYIFRCQTEGLMPGKDSADDVVVEVTYALPKTAPPVTLSTLGSLNVATTQAVEAREAYVDELEYLVPEFIAKGHIVFVVAKPNSAKTLLLLSLVHAMYKAREDITSIYYFNEDDGAIGALEKERVFADTGLNILTGQRCAEINPHSPYQKPDDIFAVMAGLIASGEARGTVFVLDTLKKFVNVMNKSGKDSMKDRMNAFRAFTQAGGTVVGLHHTNKHASEDGSVVFSGVQDLEDDCDNMFFLQPLSEDTDPEQLVEIRRGKHRYPAAGRQLFRYTKADGDRWADLLLSSELVRDEEGMVKLRNQLTHKASKAEFDRLYGKWIPTVRKVMEENGGEYAKSRLAQAISEATPKVSDGETLADQSRELTRKSAETLVAILSKAGLLELRSGSGGGFVYGLNTEWKAIDVHWDEIML